jgi:hypothetical protein
MKPLDEQINEFAMHLIKREAEVRPRSNKRSIKEHEKFLLSTRWLCRKLLLAHAVHKGSSIRISRDKNRYTQGRYVPEGISHRVTIEGVLDLMDILGYVQLTDRGNFDRISGKGGQTRYKAKAFICSSNDFINALLHLNFLTELNLWLNIPQIIPLFLYRLNLYL